MPFAIRCIDGFSCSKGIVRAPRLDQRNRRVGSLHMSNNQFDISKPVFDLLSLRSVRGDALVRYDALNQSEPLRISLFAILCLTLLAAPSLSEAIGYDKMSVPSTIASVVCAAGSAGLLYRECSRRAKQLNRIEKELNTELLPIRLPMNAFADMAFSKPVPLKALRGLSNPPRIIAICGDKSKLQEALGGLSVLGRRLQQASVYVVAIPTDGSKLSDWQVSGYTPWLADADEDKVWLGYFDSLDSASVPFRWFGLNSSGRSIGSGEEVPLWMQVLGQHLRPTEVLDESDAAIKSDNSEERSVLEALESFYQALTIGKEEEIQGIFSEVSSAQVSEVRNYCLMNLLDWPCLFLLCPFLFDFRYWKLEDESILGGIALPMEHGQRACRFLEQTRLFYRRLRLILLW